MGKAAVKTGVEEGSPQFSKLTEEEWTTWTCLMGKGQDHLSGEHVLNAAAVVKLTQGLEVCMGVPFHKWPTGKGREQEAGWIALTPRRTASADLCAKLLKSEKDREKALEKEVQQGKQKQEKEAKQAKKTEQKHEKEEKQAKKTEQKQVKEEKQAKKTEQKQEREEKQAKKTKKPRLRTLQEFQTEFLALTSDCPEHVRAFLAIKLLPTPRTPHEQELLLGLVESLQGHSRKTHRQS